MTPLTALTHHPFLKGKVNPDLILVSIYLDGSSGSEGSHYAHPFSRIGHLTCYKILRWTDGRPALVTISLAYILNLPE